VPQANVAADPEAEDNSEALAAIRGVHGGAGPWVVAGYRMGRYALAKLGLERGSFDLEVVHHSPREVQYSCIADGAAAATGASLGRLSLSLEPAVAPETRTTYHNKRTGTSVTLATTAAFAQRFESVPRPQLSAAGEQVLQLPDAAIFRELPLQ
jgi:formylmethanofuran dehydrogenase subunit E